MASWQLQDAKARFTKVLNTAWKKGPQNRHAPRRGDGRPRAHPRLEAARTGRAAHIKEFAAWSWPLLSQSSAETRRAEARSNSSDSLSAGHQCRLRTPQAKPARRGLSLAAKSSRRSDLYLRRHNGETPAGYRAHSKAERGQGSRNRNLARPNGSFTQPALNGRSLLSRMGPAQLTRVRASS